MLRKLTVGAATAGIAAAALITPAVAAETPTVDPGFSHVVVDGQPTEAPAKPAKLSPGEQADLTGKQLDNAKKGVETAKGIVDTLAGLGGLFGLGTGK